MRRFTFLPELPPDDAEVHGRLKFQRIDNPRESPHVKAWRGKQRSPYAYHRFRNLDKREAWISEQKAGEDASVKFKAELAETKARQVAEMCEQIKVGTLLHYSWGYDQTQCEYFQVVARTARTATIREIGSESVPGSDGFMSEYRRPVPDAFLDSSRPMRKKINVFGVGMAHGCACPTSADAKHYCSWYA